MALTILQIAVLRMSEVANRRQLVLIYDGECPVCQRYSTMLRIRKDIGDLELINARESEAVRLEVEQAGYDLDEGMVLKVDDQVYWGADAMHMLALMSTPSGFFNRMQAYIFGSKRASVLLYPVLRLGRNTLLWLLRKQKINS